MKRTPAFAILIVLFCTLLTSSGQYFMKLGVNNLQSLLSVVNLNVVLGLGLYILGGTLLVIALKYGELSTLYPIISLSFVWIFIISAFILGEAIIFANVVGLASIILGVSFIGWGANSE